MAIERIEARERGWTERSHDDADFGALHRLYYNDLVAFVHRRVRDRHLAEDIAQESFLRAYAARRSFDAEQPAWPWLVTIARNAMLNTLRNERRAKRHLSITDDVADDAAGTTIANDPEDHAVLMDEINGLGVSLQALPIRQRRLLLLRTVDDLSYDEIARREKISVDALKAHLRRARRTLRAVVADPAADSFALLPAISAAMRRLRARASSAMNVLNSSIGAWTPLEGAMHFTCLALTALAVLHGAGALPAAAAEGSHRHSIARGDVERPAGASSHEDQVAPGRITATRLHHNLNAGAVTISGGVDRSDPGQRSIIVTVDPHVPGSEGTHNAVTVQAPCTYRGVDVPCQRVDPGP